MISIIEDNLLHLPLTREFLAFCTKEFSVRNPDFDNPFRDKTLPTSEIIRGYKLNYSTQKIEVKRGLKSYVLNYLYKNNYEYEIIDKTCKRSINVNFAFPNPEFKLKDYQEIGKLAFLRRGNGIISFDCGMGKTVLALSIVGELKTSTIILVHTNALLNQWANEIKELIHGEYSLGIIGGGSISFGDITIALFQSFSNLMGNVEVFEKFGFVIVDECHHIPAETFYNVITSFKAKNYLGLSATLERKDCKQFLTKFAIGDCLYQRKRQDIGMEQIVYVRRTMNIPTQTRVIDKKTKRLKVKPLKLTKTMRGSKKQIPNWVDAIGGICFEKKRTEDIIYDVVNVVKMGRKPLILSDRVEHCKEMYAALQPYCTVRLAIGGDSDGLEVYKANPDSYDAIVGTKVADEGLDIPSLDTLFLTCPMSIKDAAGDRNTALLDQRIGRIARPYAGKTQIEVYLYMDLFIDYFNSTVSAMIDYLEKDANFQVKNLN